jgi:hypothetical protein
MIFGLCFTVGPWLGMEVLERSGGTVLWGATLVLGLVSAALMIRLPEPPAPEAQGSA